MKNKLNIAAIIWIVWALIYIWLNLKIAIQISEGFTFAEWLLPELINLFIIWILIIMPWILLIIKNINSIISYFYPLLMLLLISTNYIWNDALEAWLLGIFILILLIIYTIIIIANWNKKHKNTTN